MTSGITGDVHPFFVAMAGNEVDVAYLAGGDGATGAPIVYKTSNGGGTWVPVFLTESNANIATGWSGDGGDMDWWYGEYALGFAVAPTDPNRVIVTDLGYAHVSSDGGATWHQAYVQPACENPAGSPTPQGLAYAGNGLEDTSVWSLHWASREVVVASFTDIRGIRSSDRGRTWSAGPSLGLPHNTTYHVVEQEGTGALYAATSTVHDQWSAAAPGTPQSVALSQASLGATYQQYASLARPAKAPHLTTTRAPRDDPR